MKVFTFKKGLHPPDNKHRTEAKEIVTILPKPGTEMIFPMIQHIGAACEPIVAKGERVLAGQKIADSKAFVSSPIIASESGTVKEFRKTLTPGGIKCNAIVIETDGLCEKSPSIKPNPQYEQLPKERVLELIREAGIVGLGGAGFPTHVKLNPPPKKKIDTIIVNAAECEPFLTNDHRSMLENTDELIRGLQIVLRLHPGAKGIIGIETNKMDAYGKLCAATSNLPNIEIMPLEPKYPQGAEKQLIFACTKREVPSGALPSEVGCIVNNVATITAIERAIVSGWPLMDKIVTISGGAVAKPGNYKVKIGMSCNEILEEIDGFSTKPYKLISGGPMMGIAMFDLHVPISKTSSAFVFLTEAEGKTTEERNCIRCGRCVQTCPAGLMPLELNLNVLLSDMVAFGKNSGMDCIECGSCSYICPAKRHLAQSIRVGKREISARSRRERKK